MKTIIKFKNLVFILFFFFCCITYAQQHFCHFDSLMLADTTAYNSYYAHQKSIRQNKPTDFKRNTFSSSKRSSHKTANYIIPIVVHVIHNNKAYGQQNNITNYQIQQQIDSLNHAMKAANNGIQFCFATKKPDGSPFSGILRHNSTILPYVGTNGGLQQLPATFNLDPDRYLNIYIIEHFYDRFPTNNISSVRGIGLPKSYDPLYNGIMMSADYFGNFNSCDSCYLDSSSTGKIFIHEVGHYLGLLHTFHGGCAGNTPQTCNTSGDLCCDTPPEDGPHWFCQYELNTCTETPTDQDDPLNNYMSYRTDCWSEFTNDQIALMHSTIEDVYAEMIDIDNLKQTGANQCGYHTALFSANRLSACDSGSFLLTALDTNDGNHLFEWHIYNASGALIAYHSSASNSYTWKGLLPGQYSVALTTTVGVERITYTRHLWLKIYNCKNKLQSSHGNWYFGEYAGMNFKSESPTIDNEPKENSPIAINVNENTISQSNSKGGILFYGGQQMFINNNPYDQRMRLYDKEHIVIPNGDSIYMGFNVISVPRPYFPGQYFIITSSDRYPSTYPTAKYVGLYYNVFDTSLRSGLGDVVMSFKNKPVLPPSNYPSGYLSYPGNTALWSGNNMMVIPTCNNSEYWLMVQNHKVHKDSMFVYLIQSGGITFSHVDTSVKSIAYFNSKVSPDGRWVYLAGKLYRFDRQNGTLKLIKTLTNKTEDYCAFSANSKVLYYYVQEGTDYIIKQLDLSNEIRAPYNIYIPTNNNPRMELAPNGKIYIGNKGYTYLSVINHPHIMNTNFSPNACGYEPRGFYTKEGNKGGVFKEGLPNVLITAKDSSIKKDIISVKKSCYKVLFTTSKTCIGSYNWDFGDQTSGSGLEVEHTYTSMGKYTVVLTIGSDTVQRTIHIGVDTIGFDVLGVINVCDINRQNNYQIKKANPNLTYQWQVSNGTIVGQNTQNNVNVLWNLSGANKIRLIATSHEGCKDTVEKTITPRTQLSNNTIYMDADYCDFDSIHGNIPPESDANTLFFWHYKTVGSNTWQPMQTPTLNHRIMPLNSSKSMIYTRFAKIGDCVFQSNEIQVTTLNHRNVLKKDITDICYPVIRSNNIAALYPGADVTWQKSTDQINWQTITLNIDSTLVIPGLTDTNINYRRVVEYYNCLSYSNVISGNNTYITKQPIAESVCFNTPKQLKVHFKTNSYYQMGDLVNLQYKHKDSTNWITHLVSLSSKDTILVFNNLADSMKDNYEGRLSIENPGCGLNTAMYSDVFEINTIGSFSITQNLRDTSIAYGESVKFKITLNNNNSATKFTWQKFSNGQWHDIPNSNADSLIFYTSQCNTQIDFKVRIEHPCTTVYSSIAALTITHLLTPKSDYWMKNTTADVGNEPDEYSDGFAKSTDIWIRHNQDGIKQHQDLNTEADICYVYVTVRNRGTSPTQAAKLYTYWTWGATQETWNLNWIKSDQNRIYINNQYSPMGGEINTIGINIPEIAAGSSVDIAIPWSDFPKKGWYDLNSQKWEKQRINICLLARIQTCDVAPFGMTNFERTDVFYNIKFNNNIVSRNTYTLPLKRSRSIDYDTDNNDGEQYYIINPNIIDGGTIAVRNNDEEARKSSICIKTINVDYFDKAETYIEIGEGLKAAIEWSPLVSYSGLTHVIDNIYQVTSSNACFEDVVLPAHFQDAVLPLFAYKDINDRFADGLSFNTSIQQKDSLGNLLGECIFTLTDNLFVNPEPTYIEDDTAFYICNTENADPETLTTEYVYPAAFPYVVLDDNNEEVAQEYTHTYQLNQGTYRFMATDSSTFTKYITSVYVEVNTDCLPDTIFNISDTLFSFCNDGVSPNYVNYSISPPLIYQVFDDNSNPVYEISPYNFNLHVGNYTVITYDSTTLTHHTVSVAIEENFECHPDTIFQTSDTVLYFCNDGISPSLVDYFISPPLIYEVFDVYSSPVYEISPYNFQLNEGHYTIITYDSTTLTHHTISVEVAPRELDVSYFSDTLSFDCELGYYGLNIYDNQTLVYNENDDLVTETSFWYYELDAVNHQYKTIYTNQEACESEETTLHFIDNYYLPIDVAANIYGDFNTETDTCAFFKVDELLCNGNAINNSPTIEVFDIYGTHLLSTGFVSHITRGNGFYFCPPYWNNEPEHIYDWYSLVIRTDFCEYCRFDFRYDSTGIYDRKSSLTNATLIKNRVMLYPNPANQNVNIHILGAAETGLETITIQILDQTGRILEDKVHALNKDGNIKLSMEQYANGVYFIKIPALKYDGKVVLIKE